ncbi:MAG: malto-oligosyltrehalose trehalohydrolase [Acidimicrobiales bacterium]
MAAIRVWAPRAQRVDMLTRRGRAAMVAGSDGWHTAERQLDAGDDYAFSLDGGPPRPDPRSAWQPAGVEGPSRVVDHSAFPWSDSAWAGRPLADTVLYELHVGTFSPEGTFTGAVARLDHLVDLGVGTIELMPVAEFPGRRGWGYDGVDLFAVNSAYGGPEGLKRLVDAAHGRGLAVVIDVVYNHLGPAGNHLAELGPYFTERYRTPWGEAVNFDGAGSDEVRRFVIDNALMWLRDYHADGLRLDAVHAILDTSAVHILEEMAAAVDGLEAELEREMWLIAESDLNDPRVVTPRDRGGLGIDAQWSDDFHHALHALVTGERNGYYGDFGSLGALAKALRQAYVYDGQHSAYRGRRHGRPPERLRPSRFVGYLQTHDQVGNRARGDRITALIGPGPAKVAAALVMLGPCVPMVFQGEEWGAGSPFLYFTDHEHELGRLVSEGRRRELASFGWDPDDVPDPQAPETFDRSRLDWAEMLRPPHSDMLDWYRRLIHVRGSLPSVGVDGTFDEVSVRFDEDAGWLILDRGPVSVVCNFGKAPVRVPIGGMGPVSVLLDSSGTMRPPSSSVEVDAESVVALRSI